MSDDTATVLAEVLAAIHTYDPLMFIDHHRALFERVAAQPPPSVPAGAEVAEVPSLADVSTWLCERFGPVRDLWSQFEKLNSEVSELSEAVHGVLGHPDAIEEPAEGWEQNLRDETADVVIVCMAIAVTQGFDLQDAIAAKWARRKRGEFIAQAATGARAAGGESEALDRAARKMHEFSEMRGLTWERANASRRHGHWHDVMRERAQAVVDAYAAAPPTPPAPGVAELLAECARRMDVACGIGTPFTPQQIVRLLTPGGAEGT